MLFCCEAWAPEPSRCADFASGPEGEQGQSLLEVLGAHVTVVAPPGALGIHLVQGPAGHPIVKGVEATSPIAGAIFEGDTVVSVDDVDTSKKTYDELAAYLKSTAGSERKLSIRRAKSKPSGARRHHVVATPGSQREWKAYGEGASAE